VVGIRLIPNITSTGETGTIQVKSYFEINTGQIVPVAESALKWSVAGKALASVSTAGLVTTAKVYENAWGTVNATYDIYYGTVRLDVLNTRPDNYGTYASDGINDSWQVTYFGIDNPKGAPAQDPDGDGQTNQFEYVAGLIPTDRNSRLTFRVQPVTGQPGHKNIIISPIISGRTYSLERTTTLGTGQWFPLTGMPQSETGGQRTITDTTATAPAAFYRTVIDKP
jgi:hypothetical protein